jgi:hypothetical protein
MIMKILKLRELGMGAIVTAAIVGIGLVASSSVIANGVIFSVHVGGPDTCGNNPGCDKNFSLSAIQFADGSVKGQFTDGFSGGGGEGIHATLDCLVVIDSPFPFEGGKAAWVSGTITKGMNTNSRGETTDFAGLPVWAAVVDLGTSANDFPDLITISFIGDPAPCYTFPDPMGNGGFLDRGQVTIKEGRSR